MRIEGSANFFLWAVQQFRRAVAITEALDVCFGSSSSSEVSQTCIVGSRCKTKISLASKVAAAGEYCKNMMG